MSIDDFGPGYRIWQEILAKRQEAKERALRRYAQKLKRLNSQPAPAEPETEATPAKHCGSELPISVSCGEGKIRSRRTSS